MMTGLGQFQTWVEQQGARTVQDICPVQACKVQRVGWHIPADSARQMERGGYLVRVGPVLAVCVHDESVGVVLALCKNGVQVQQVRILLVAHALLAEAGQQRVRMSVLREQLCVGFAR